MLGLIIHPGYSFVSNSVVSESVRLFINSFGLFSILHVDGCKSMIQHLSHYQRLDMQ